MNLLRTFVAAHPWWVVVTSAVSLLVSVAAGALFIVSLLRTLKDGIMSMFPSAKRKRSAEEFLSLRPRNPLIITARLPNKETFKFGFRFTLDTDSWWKNVLQNGLFTVVDVEGFDRTNPEHFGVVDTQIGFLRINDAGYPLPPLDRESLQAWLVDTRHTCAKA